MCATQMWRHAVTVVPNGVFMMEICEMSFNIFINPQQNIYFSKVSIYLYLYTSNITVQKKILKIVTTVCPSKYQPSQIDVVTDIKEKFMSSVNFFYLKLSPSLRSALGQMSDHLFTQFHSLLS